MSEDLEVVIPNPSLRLIFGCRPSIVATSILALRPSFLNFKQLLHATLAPPY